MTSETRGKRGVVKFWSSNPVMPQARGRLKRLGELIRCSITSYRLIAHGSRSGGRAWSGHRVLQGRVPVADDSSAMERATRFDLDRCLARECENTAFGGLPLPGVRPLGEPQCLSRRV